MSTLSTTNLKNPSSGSNNIVLATDGSATIATLSSTTITGTTIQGTIKSGTSVASTSGTSIDFTSIPSWVKRITVMLNQVSTNGTSAAQLQLGTSSGVETSSYVGQVYGEYPIGGSSSLSAGFLITHPTYFAAASTYTAKYIIQNINSNNWIASGFCVENGGSNYCFWTTGSKSLSATLDRIRITTAGGSNTFDAGTINIHYEG
jgi:hypothetical protein